jgi:hypothetical protein
MSSSESIEVRSFRTVFDLERRIYRIDSLRLNPGGVPVRGILYFIVVLVVVLLASALPLTGPVVRVLPWYIRDLALPIGSGAFLTIIRIEGRPFHLAAHALFRYALEPRYLSGVRPCAAPGQRWHPSELLVLPDGSDARLRRMRFVGPGAALISVVHERAVWNAGLFRRATSLTLRPLAKQRALSKGQVIELQEGVALEVYGSPSQIELPGLSGHPTRPGAMNPGHSNHPSGGAGERYRWGYG